jgi:hypothetical protein
MVTPYSEPSAAARGLAALTRQQYNAFTEAGFAETDAFALTATWFSYACGSTPTHEDPPKP